MIIGPHVNRNKVKLSSERPLITEHIQKAILDASISVKVISIFVGSPRVRIITLKEDEQKELKKMIKETGLRVIAHSSYAGSPWNGNPEAIAYIKKEIQVCLNSSIEGLVLHLPKKDPSVVIKYLKKLDNALRVVGDTSYGQTVGNTSSGRAFVIYLETPAFVPPKKKTDPPLFYSTPENLNSLFKLIHKEVEYKHYCLCVDTAHLWVAGENIQTYDGAKSWFNKLDNKNIIIHLNDSARAQGTGPDKHASLMKGKIWNKLKQKNGLQFILEFAKKNKIPLILERPNNDMLIDDYNFLKNS